MIINDDVFNVIKTLKDTSISLVFCDPPYNLSSTWKIDPTDGKVKHKKQSDFMDKWGGLSGEQLEVLFKEMYRITKFGAYVVMYSIDRQQMPFEYYAQLAGFDPQQYLYSYKISSFPKAMDISKAMDNREGAEREIVGKKTGRASKPVANIKGGNYIGYVGNIDLSDITAPSSDLAKKYDGYKASISPYKQVLETVMVFKKPYPKGMSNIDAIYEYEEGNKEISPAIVNIDGGRVPTEEVITNHSRSEESSKSKGIYGDSKSQETHQTFGQSLGRYPSQLFIVDDERLKEEIGYNTSDILDKQSGILISGDIKPHVQKNKDVGYMNCAKVTSHRESSSGGSSRINHKCLYSEEEYDILRYCTKTSTAERNAGYEEFDSVSYGMSSDANSVLKNGIDSYIQKTDGIGLNKIKKVKNNHPCLKSLELNYHIIKLFIPPVDNIKDFTVFNPFSGSGSEYIGLLSNGVIEDNVIACELNKDYYDISLARIDYWKDKKFMFRKEDKKELEGIKKKEIKKNKWENKKSIF